MRTSAMLKLVAAATLIAASAAQAAVIRYAAVLGPEVTGATGSGFVVVDCLVCGSGRLKPDVVFFGETVPRQRVEECLALVDGARVLLVLGSSLTVMSGYRFVLRAVERGIPVAIVNRGPTRGDSRAAVRLDAPLGQVLPDLARRLLP